MRWNLLAALVGVGPPARVGGAPPAKTEFPVEYPIRHYAISTDAGDLAMWRVEVRAFRKQLREQYSTEVSIPKLLSDSKEEQFLDRAVDPKRLVFSNPGYFFKTPVLMSWWEVIDERGRVQRVFVVASNQTKEADTRILAWCVNDKLWKPGELDGNPTTTIRTASINLGESKYHFNYWQKHASAKAVIMVTLIAGALAVWLVSNILRVRHEKRVRHEALMKHVAHKPFHAPSIDEPPKL